jgi:hypothetical protein
MRLICSCAAVFPKSGVSTVRTGGRGTIPMRASIVERDVAPVTAVRRPDTLRRLINQLAHRTADELNVSSLCHVLGACKETVTSYLDVLSRLGIVHRRLTRPGVWRLPRKLMATLL